MTDKLDTRLVIVVAVTVVVLIAYQFLLLGPKNDELATVRADIESVETQQNQSRQRVRQLEAARSAAPETEAALAAARAVIPADPGLAAAYGQIQDAADASGIVLRSVLPGLPAVQREDALALAKTEVSVEAQGSFFQTIDFLRRIEDPTLTARGITVGSVVLAVEEYPRLDLDLRLIMWSQTTYDSAPELLGLTGGEG